MKKLFAISALLFATLMFSCCEKDPDPNPLPQTIEDLKDAKSFNGEWEFVSLYDGYHDRSDCVNENNEYFYSFSIHDSKGDIIHYCTGEPLAEDYTVIYTSNNRSLIITSNGLMRYEFTVVSFNNGILKLKLIGPEVVLTVQRQ